MIKFETDTSGFPEDQDGIALARDGCEDYCGVSEGPKCRNEGELQSQTDLR